MKLTFRFKEASQGYFHDYNKARKAFGGKLWTAPNTLIREDVSRYVGLIQMKIIRADEVASVVLPGS